MSNARDDRGWVHDVAIIGALVAAGVLLVSLDDREHAGMLFAGALALAVPRASSAVAPRVPPQLITLGVGFGAAVALSGCSRDPSSGASSLASFGLLSIVIALLVPAVIVLARVVRDRVRASILGLALVVSTCAGCAGGSAELRPVVTSGCAIARKVCAIVSGACGVVDATAPAEHADAAPD